MLLFLSTLSLRRATANDTNNATSKEISIHALLAESDFVMPFFALSGAISIHALLAESDPLADGAEPHAAISIHALLAESDTFPLTSKAISSHFYPRSPCGERPFSAVALSVLPHISIHALLAESDLLYTVE